jgi:hypothetical protein
MSPRFSIVSSFFGDDPSYIYRLYECAKAQNVDWEWIVTDDFSDNPETDKALIEISKKDKRVRRIIQTEKLEFYRNPSLYARGEFVFHIDGDDFYHPSYLEHCQTWFDRLPDVSIILSGSKWVKKSGHLERYYLHNPFINNVSRASDGSYRLNINFLGRIWRNKFKIDWNNVFEDSSEMIRMNDKYIVNYLSTKGDVLCLPRCYIQYETAKISNSSRERTEDEKILINKVDREFNKWYSTTMPNFLFSTHFCNGDNTDFEVECYPFLTLPWTKDKLKVGVFGFSEHKFKRKQLIQLFPDFDITFDPNELESSNISTFVINAMNSKIFDIPNGRLFILTNNEETRNFYFDSLRKKGKSASWFLYDSFCWINTL